MTHWASDALFYHIYPLGFCGAPRHNDFVSDPAPRLERIYSWIDHIKRLGANALYLGPVFESTVHGYDTADYFHVDRRLGTDDTLRELIATLHREEFRVILDGVFNHVGRDFWAFRDVLAHGQASAFCSWFAGLDFSRRSPYGDPFGYEGWNGHYDLVKLNLHNPDTRNHLLGAVETWAREYDIDGLRLDAVDVIDKGFLKDLAAYARSLRSDFWLMGEVVFGDYRQWANPEMLDSVTNYEGYKALYSSHVDQNYFEIAYALNRQFGEGGLYRNLPLYAFADNHDVDRVASSLQNLAHLYPLHILLMTMPGVPSIYYGSEWGLQANRQNGGSWELRPALNLDMVSRDCPQPELAPTIARLARIRSDMPVLRYGSYRQLHVAAQQFAFMRQLADQAVIVAVNAADQPVPMEIPIPDQAGRLVDVLNPGDTFPVFQGKARIDRVWPHWGRILVAA
ncbi:MAG: alpha-glucosidase C-terminal domain-containing protein [Anaerolineae bacterium]|nr:alpha-glucosidase C-terminal domain-containing protein [Anaerolineae bacterium]